MWLLRRKPSWYARMGAVCRNRWVQRGSLAVAVAGLLLRGISRRRSTRMADANVL